MQYSNHWVQNRHLQTFPNRDLASFTIKCTKYGSPGPKIMLGRSAQVNKSSTPLALNTNTSTCIRSSFIASSYWSRSTKPLKLMSFPVKLHCSSIKIRNKNKNKSFKGHKPHRGRATTRRRRKHHFSRQRRRLRSQYTRGAGRLTAGTRRWGFWRR